MGRKSALAGLWWGGGKGVIARPGTDTHLDPAYRQALFTEYGQFLTSLQGCYVTAEDSGVHVQDMDIVYRACRWTTCISASLGGSGNPSVPTAMGVRAAMEGAAEHLGWGSLEGRTVALQGLGNVGHPLVGFLLERGVGRIVGADVTASRVEAAEASYGGDGRCEFRLVAPTDVSIMAEEADIFSPCGFGAVLNSDTIPTCNAKVVVGAANNQLATPADADLIQQAGIVYVPDVVANRMGIVNCANEQVGMCSACSSV